MRKVGRNDTDWFHRRELFIQKWLPEINKMAASFSRIGVNKIPKDDLVQHACLHLTMIGIIKLWKMDKDGDVIPFVRDSFKNFVSEWRKPFSRMTSLESIGKNKDSEDFDVLDVLHVDQVENELRKLVPDDPNERRELHDVCVQRLEEMKVRRNGDKFSFVLSLNDKILTVGGYDSRMKAQSAYTDCWRRIRNLCLPFFVKEKHTFKSFNKAQTVDFWIKVRDLDKTGNALPSFFYGCPLHALIVLEEMQSRKEHIYKIESIDQYMRQRLNEKKWRSASGVKIEKAYRTLDKWKEILSQGLRDSEIVKKYGCSYGAIGAARARIAAGVQPRKLRA